MDTTHSVHIETNDTHDLQQAENIPFSTYLANCRELISKRHRHFLRYGVLPEKILEANCPFEFRPAIPASLETTHKCGVLLVHGLFDSPFSLKEIGTYLASQGILARSVLLPGHGTTPEDLIQVHYQDWIRTIEYGVQSLQEEVDKIFLIGYSTGAALSLYEAMHNPKIAGIILVAPAIRIKPPMPLLKSLEHFKRWRNPEQAWVTRQEEIDYTKYRSFAFNPVYQVAALTEVIHTKQRQQAYTCPCFIIVSREDETISSHSAIDFFVSQDHPESRLLLYSVFEHLYTDQRIISRPAYYPNLHIQHFSHISLPFSPHNTHYGQAGDFPLCSQPGLNNILYGAYNPLEEKCSELLYQLRIMKNKRRSLTYNPDFDFTLEQILSFINNICLQ